MNTRQRANVRQELRQLMINPNMLKEIGSSFLMPGALDKCTFYFITFCKAVLFQVIATCCVVDRLLKF